MPRAFVRRSGSMHRNLIWLSQTAATSGTVEPIRHNNIAALTLTATHGVT